MTATSTGYYVDLREYLDVLEQRGQLVRIKRACRAGSRAIYAIGMRVASAAEISERWLAAQRHLLQPRQPGRAQA